MYQATETKQPEPVSVARIQPAQPAAPIAASTTPPVAPAAQPQQQRVNQPQQYGNIDFNDDEYAVPTFLRRQAD